MRASSDFLESIMELSRTGNPNALTDLLGSCYLSQTSTKIASLNVKINLDSLEDSLERRNISQEMETLLTLSAEKSSLIESIIRERLKWD